MTDFVYYICNVFNSTKKCERSLEKKTIKVCQSWSSEKNVKYFQFSDPVILFLCHYMYSMTNSLNRYCYRCRDNLKTNFNTLMKGRIKRRDGFTRITIRSIYTNMRMFTIIILISERNIIICNTIRFLK